MDEFLNEITLNLSTPDIFWSKFIDFCFTLGTKIIAALLIFFIGRWLIKKVIRLVIRIMRRRQADPSLFSFFTSFVAITLNFTLIIIIVGILGIETSSFIALFASAGIAIGMALSGTLQNFAGGVMILLFKPFRVGDYIEAQGQSGKVKEIQIFNTIITTSDNKTIIVPNGGLSTGITMNYTKEETRRVEWRFNIAYGESYDKVYEVLENLIKADNRILESPSYLIALYSLGESSLEIVVRAWVRSRDYWAVFFEMNEKVYKTFTKENISIPYPQLDIHLIQPETK